MVKIDETIRRHATRVSWMCGAWRLTVRDGAAGRPWRGQPAGRSPRP